MSLCLEPSWREMGVHCHSSSMAGHWCHVRRSGGCCWAAIQGAKQKPKPTCAQPFHAGFLTGPQFRTAHQVLTQPVNTNKAKLKLQLKTHGISSEILAVFAIKGCIRNRIRFALTLAKFSITTPITNINGFIFKICAQWRERAHAEWAVGGGQVLKICRKHNQYKLRYILNIIST